MFRSHSVGVASGWTAYLCSANRNEVALTMVQRLQYRFCARCAPLSVWSVEFGGAVPCQATCTRCKIRRCVT